MPLMRSLRCAILVLLFVYFVDVAYGGVGNCTEASEYVTTKSPGGSAVLTLNGTVATMTAAKNGKTFPHSFELSIQLLALGERDKKKASGSCKVPTGIGDQYADPWMVHEPGKPNSTYSPVIRRMELSAFDCYPREFQDVVEGVNITGIAIDYFAVDMPTFNFTQKFEFATKSLQVLSSNVTKFYNGTEYFYKWRKDTLKLTWKGQGYEWSPNTTNPFLSAHWNVFAYLPSGGKGQSFENSSMVKVDYRTREQLLAYEFEKTQVVDGIPYMDLKGGSDRTIRLEPPGDLPIPAYLGIPFCDDNFGRWTELIYDPQFTTLFIGDPIGPVASKTRKQTDVTKIVAPVVVCSVVLIVVVVALAVWYVPSLHRKFIPARLASAKKPFPSDPGQKSPAPQTSPGWTKASPSAT